MEIKEGDKVHVKRLSGLDTDFYATLTKFQDGVGQLQCSTGSLHDRRWVYLPYRDKFGPDKEDFYTLATDEEDTEEPVIQRIEHINKAIEETKKYIEQATHDPVNKPSHYMLGHIEVKDIIAIVADKYHKGSVAHNVASALEYQMRAPEKNGLEDIKKARKCLDFAIENWE
ncbi:DUF3310 domain-containing protein [Mammaliicoccus sciuri]|uniref:DUF3310 domain-containing protein n=1 Tax=Mammaliicoccus sciuri TaxID=1296 RepID=UPI001784C16D|nr:DUF3310 domain-containing protein [Mammaliicoccus sciuri]